MGNAMLQKNEKKYARLYAFISLLLICFYLVTEIVFELWYKVAANYGLFLIVTFIALSFFLRFFNSSKEEKCIALYAVWVLITRALNGDLFLDREFYFLVRTVLFTGCFICVGFVLDSKDRKSFFNLVCAVVCGYWLILSVIGLYATVNLERIQLPFSDATIGYARVGANYQLTMDNIHRNVTGVWFALATILMLYHHFSCKNILIKVFTAVSALIFYVATAMSFCRSAQIALSVAITMLAMLLSLEYLSKKKQKIKVFAVALIMIIVLPLSYLGYGAATGMCSMISANIAAVSAEETAEVAESPMENDADIQSADMQAKSEASDDENRASSNEESESEAVFSEGRGKDNVLMLGGRTYLWKAGILTMLEEPERFVKGGMLDSYMTRVVEICTEIADRENPDVNGQMHNFILDALLLTGVAGAVILLVFTVFFVVRMVKVFFSASPEVKLELKMLTLPLAFLLVDNMMEAHIFRYAIMPSIMFFFIAGIFLAWSYEALPRTKK